jgi:outer membrane protein TolC
LSLARLLGREPQADLRAAGELQAPVLPEQGPPKGLEELPAMQRAQAALDSAEEDLRRSRATWWPSLGASASVGRSGGDWLSESGSWSAGLSLSLPLFQGGSRLASTQAAGSRLLEARRVLIQAQRQLRLDLEQSYGSLADAVDNAEVQALFLEAGLLRAEVAQAQYTQGLLGFEAWDQVESDLINAQVQALSSRGDAQRALAAWERSLGRDLWP